MHVLKRCRRVPLLAGLFCVLHAAVSAQEMAQTIQLVPGWNAVHLTVSPSLVADALFRGWPVQSVGVYDAAAFTRTRQFDATGSSEGLRSPAVRIWHRQIPGDSEVFAIPANAVLLCFATNTFSTTLYGAPEALRYSWHPTGPATVYNYIGISVTPGASPNLAVYCSGLPLGDIFDIYAPGDKMPSLEKSLTRQAVLTGEPGAGKTAFALRVAAELLADRVINAVTVVTPTEHLKHQWADAALRVGLHLEPEWSARDGALPADMHGVVTTYQQVATSAAALAPLSRDAFVVFDEIHHAGDDRAWGDSVLRAFIEAPRRLSISGTPFRSDTRAIPFVRYVLD